MTRYAALLAAAVVLMAQAPPDAADVAADTIPERLDGRLMLVDAPADSGTVVLHGVNPEEAGPLDSTRVDAEGRFSFDLRRAPPIGGGQSLFVSHRYDGILYFGPPLFQPEELPEEYLVRAFPTRTAPPGGLSLPVEIRNLIVEEGPGVWRVTDIIQVHNDSSVTWVSDDGTTPIWHYPLPPDATSFRLMDGELGAGDVRFEDGTLLVSRSFPPGDRLFVVQYDLASLETSIPLTGRTDAVEFLVREPAPSLRVEGLEPGPPVEMDEGGAYLRWWAQDTEDRVVLVSIGEDTELPTVLIAVGVSLLLILIGTVFVRRTGRPGGVPDAPAKMVTRRRRRSEILLSIARLDEEAESGAPTTRGDDRSRRRQELLDELARLDAEVTEAGKGRSDG